MNDRSSHRPILMFDSGVGGLTVLREARVLMPDRRIVYVADDKAFPYGAWEEPALQAHILDLFAKLVDGRESFWTAVYPLYMNREITKGNMRDLIHRGLAEARGNYKIVLRLFNMESSDYKRFLNFLRKHDCQLPFKEYRQ